VWQFDCVHSYTRMFVYEYILIHHNLPRMFNKRWQRRTGSLWIISCRLRDLVLMAICPVKRIYFILLCNYIISLICNYVKNTSSEDVYNSVFSSNFVGCIRFQSLQKWNMTGIGIQGQTINCLKDFSQCFELGQNANGSEVQKFKYGGTAQLSTPELLSWTEIRLQKLVQFLMWTQLYKGFYFRIRKFNLSDIFLSVFHGNSYSQESTDNLLIYWYDGARYLDWISQTSRNSRNQSF
jgi:hypothetical protein